MSSSKQSSRPVMFCLRGLAAAAIGLAAAGPGFAEAPPGTSSAITVAVGGEMSFNIPSGKLVGALDTFARQAGIPVVFDRTKVDGLTTAGLNGIHPVQEGLDTLLQGTGYVSRPEGAGFALVAAPPASAMLSSEPIAIR